MNKSNELTIHLANKISKLLEGVGTDNSSNNHLLVEICEILILQTQALVKAKEEIGQELKEAGDLIKELAQNQQILLDCVKDLARTSGRVP